MFLLSGVALPHSVLTLALVGLTSVIGDLFMKLSSVKAGMYIPVRLRGPGGGNGKAPAASPEATNVNGAESLVKTLLVNSADLCFANPGTSRKC